MAKKPEKTNDKQAASGYFDCQETVKQEKIALFAAIGGLALCAGFLVWTFIKVWRVPG